MSQEMDIGTDTPVGNLLDAGLGFVRGPVGRKGALTLFDQAVASATNFLTGVIIGRSVGKEQFGLYTLGFTVVLLLVSCQSSIITTPYTVRSPHLKGRRQKSYTGSTLIHHWGFAALSAVLVAVGAAVLSAPGSAGGLARVLWALAAVIFFVLSREYARAISLAQLRMGAAALIDLGVAAVQLCGLLVMAHMVRLSVPRAYGVIGMACGMPAIAWLVLSFKGFSVSLTSVSADLKGNWSLGKWVLAASLAAQASSLLYPWFLTVFLGTGATGGYNACLSMVFLANPFLMGMTNYLGPATAHGLAEGGRRCLDRIVLRGTVLVAACMCLFSAVAVVAGGWLVPALYGSEYAGYGSVVSLLALGYLVQSLALPANCGLLADGRPEVIFWSHVIAAGAPVLLGGPLVFAYGLRGAAVGIIIKDALATGYRLASFWKRQ